MNRNKWKKFFAIAMVFIMAVSLLLSFDTVAAPVAKVLKTSASTVVFYARSVFVGALGLWLISTGVAGLAVPVVGIILIAVGIVLVGYAIWPMFKTQTKPEGQ